MFQKEVKQLALYDVEHRMAMEPMQGKWSSSPDDLAYHIIQNKGLDSL